MAYYEEILVEIKEKIVQEKYEQALFLIQKELEMPYIPLKVEQELKGLEKVCRSYGQKSKGDLSVEETLSLLKGNSRQQMRAVQLLADRNLHQCVNEIQDYLSSNPDPNAAAFLIESLALQQVREEFCLIKDGLEYVFWPEEVQPIAENEGFLKAREYLKEWLENKHPDMLEMAYSLLAYRCYLFLPLSYDLEEAKELALDCLKEVSESLEDGKTYQKVRDTLEKRSRMP